MSLILQIYFRVKNWKVKRYGEHVYTRVYHENMFFLKKKMAQSACQVFGGWLEGTPKGFLILTSFRAQCTRRFHVDHFCRFLLDPHFAGLYSHSDTKLSFVLGKFEHLI